MAIEAPNRLHPLVHSDPQMVYQLLLEVIPGCPIIYRLMSNTECFLLAFAHLASSFRIKTSPFQVQFYDVHHYDGIGGVPLRGEHP